jgi:hypothetical protein
MSCRHRSLLIAPPLSEAAKILEKTGLVGVYSGSDIHGIKTFLSDRMKGGFLPGKNPHMYAWSNVAKQFDTILRAAVETAHG